MADDGIKPKQPDKREAMRQFATGAFDFAVKWVPGSRIVRNFDSDVFRHLYGLSDDAGPTRPADYLDMHGRRFFRPPGAIHEDEFLDTCKRCHKCIDACPEDVILSADKNAGPPAGTPILFPNRGPCTLCGDCMDACPTGALVKTPLNRIRIGIAVVEPDTCLGYQGEECTDCRDSCPLEPNAIELDGTVPKVDSRICTGCGLCVEACPTEPTSIVVLPRPQRPRAPEPANGSQT